MTDVQHMTTAEQLRLFRATYPYRSTIVDGVRWDYIAAGAGDHALLLLPGAPGRGDTSFQYVLAFADRYRVLAPDYPAAITTATALVDGLAGLLRAEGVERVHVLGGSYSGMVAQCLLRRSPALLDRLILADTGVPNRRRAPQTRLLGRCIDVLPFGLVRALLKAGTYWFVRPMGSEGTFWRRYFHELLDGLRREDMEARLAVALDIDAHARFAPWDDPDWHGAILVLDSAGDSVFDATEQRGLRALYPRATYRTVGAGGHAGSLAAAHTYIAAIAAFLDAGEAHTP